MNENIYKNKKILTVDDNLNILNLYKYFFNNSDYILFQAEDGMIALDLIEKEMPDIIITDVLMPKIDGFELCNKLKSNPEFSNIPIIIVTNLADEEKKIMGLEAGADDFITKPFSGQILLAKVKSLLRHKYLEEQIKRAEKMQLFYATVVTTNHKINQPLCVIRNMTTLISDDLKKLDVNDAKVNERLELIRNCSDNISEVLMGLQKISEPVLKEYVGNVKMVDLKKSEDKK